MSDTINEDLVREQLKKVIDPELFVNIVDLGLIYVVDIAPSESDPAKSNVRIEMTMTSPMCPAGPQLIAQSRQYVSELEGVADVDIKVVMEPPWTPDRMTEDAKDQLNIF
jgi:metal-sulfur cluster biosynthetic enzyme